MDSHGFKGQARAREIGEISGLTALDALARLAEERIREAIERGELDDLEGAGRRLVLDDDQMVAPELRAAYRVLRNAGFVPEEVRLRCELRELETLVDAATQGDGRARALRRLELLRTRLALRPGGERALLVHDRYRQRLLERLGGAGDQEPEGEPPPGG